MKHVIDYYNTTLAKLGLDINGLNVDEKIFQGGNTRQNHIGCPTLMEGQMILKFKIYSKP